MRNNFITFIILTCLVFMFIYPEEIINASFNGLLIFGTRVFPSLLPFMIATNLLSSLGFISFLSRILNIIMVPLFKVSGVGAYPLVVGLISGYPLGAKVVCDLREKNLITKEDGNRLIMFTNNSGPLFILGSVGIGMFQSKEIGYFLLFVHVISAIISGISFSALYKTISISNTSANKNIEKLSIGQIFNNAIENSIQTSLRVGGFIIIFTIISKIISLIGIFENDIIENVFIGLIEMTNGVFLLSKEESKANIILSSFLIAFGGLSIHMQSISFICQTDISLIRYMFGKMVSSFINIIIALLTYDFFIKDTVAIFAHKENYILPVYESQNIIYFIIILLILFPVTMKLKELTKNFK